MKIQQHTGRGVLLFLFAVFAVTAYCTAGGMISRMPEAGVASMTALTLNTGAAFADSTDSADTAGGMKTANGNAVRQKVIDFLLDGIGISMMPLPGGMVSLGIQDDEEEPADSTLVTVSPFEISITEITNAQFASFLNAIYAKGSILISSGIVIGLEDDIGGKELINLHGSFDNNNKCWISFQDSTFTVAEGKGDFPVVYVTWYGADAFAKNYGLDLPTEAEWEYAARGGQHLRYATHDGKLSSSKANYSSVKRHPTKTGSYKPNPFGLYDMSGNVWEWCHDWYDERYPSVRPDKDPPGPDYGTNKVFKGGSWASRAQALRCGFSWAYEPSFKYHNIGFRVVRR